MKPTFFVENGLSTGLVVCGFFLWLVLAGPVLVFEWESSDGSVWALLMAAMPLAALVGGIRARQSFLIHFVFPCTFLPVVILTRSNGLEAQAGLGSILMSLLIWAVFFVVSSRWLARSPIEVEERDVEPLDFRVLFGQVSCIAVLAVPLFAIFFDDVINATWQHHYGESAPGSQMTFAALCILAWCVGMHLLVLEPLVLEDYRVRRLQGEHVVMCREASPSEVGKKVGLWAALAGVSIMMILLVFGRLL